jgi:signal transduction histidine kinase
MASKSKLFLKRNYQIIYAIVLILLIPLTIIFNTVSSVKSFKNNIDIELQRQAMTIGQVFSAWFVEQEVDEIDLQNKVTSIGDATPDLVSFDILFPAGENFRVAASLQEDKLGAISEDLNNIIAWHQEQTVATIAYDETASRDNAERFWQVVMPLKDQDYQKQALLRIEMSLTVMDDLVRQTLTKSYLILITTVLIVILLLAANTRIFEYALLFKKLKEVDRMKDEFISMASHELRTPITTIKGFLSMILGGDFGQLNERGQKNLKIVDASVNRLGDLVEDLLNVSRIEQKRLEVVATKVEAKQILASIIDEFELRVQEKNIELKLNIAEDLPLMLADADKLRQILVNLIGNSIKYTKKGEIELSAKKQDRKFVRIAVKDSGIGISAKARERLFDKFYRVQSEETEGIVGTGLGLWITKQLVELMGGQIFVDSIEHVGSQFYFTIPIYTEEVKAIKNV